MHGAAHAWRLLLRGERGEPDRSVPAGHVRGHLGVGGEEEGGAAGAREPGRRRDLAETPRADGELARPRVGCAGGGGVRAAAAYGVRGPAPRRVSVRLTW